MKRRALRFVLTGVGNTAVHAMVAMALIIIVGVSAGLANACAFLTATAVSYAINTLWSFGARPTRDNAFKYGIVTAVGFVGAPRARRASRPLGRTRPTENPPARRFGGETSGFPREHPQE